MVTQEGSPDKGCLADAVVVTRECGSKTFPGWSSKISYSVALSVMSKIH